MLEIIKAVVYSPSTPDKQLELKKSVSKVHAEKVVNYIKNLPFTKEEKNKLIDDILKIYI